MDHLVEHLLQLVVRVNLIGPLVGSLGRFGEAGVVGALDAMGLAGAESGVIEFDGQLSEMVVD